jgi:hypothetical protein
MTEPAPFVAIGIPSGDMVHADFAMRLANMCFNPGARAFLLNSKSSIIALGRNQCVAAAQTMKASHLLFLDSDMSFPPTTLARLLKHDKLIVGALYSRRSPPFLPLGITMDGTHVHVTDGLARMKIMPTGCLLIAMKIFESLSKPYFRFRIEGENILGEDYHFCERVTDAGFEIWCDGDLSREIGHIGQKTYDVSAAQDAAPNPIGAPP